MHAALKYQSTDPDIIRELLSIEMMCEQLKQRCYKTRKKLEGNSPASPKGVEQAKKSATAIERRMRGIRMQEPD